jgi:hypothetical protein
MAEGTVRSSFAPPLRFLLRRLETATSWPLYHRQQPSALGMDRTALLLSLINLSGVGLEIGPGFDPLVPKSSGRRVETVDHASAAELREKYRNAANVDISRIEEVDYVSDGRPLRLYRRLARHRAYARHAGLPEGL